MSYDGKGLLSDVILNALEAKDKRWRQIIRPGSATITTAGRRLFGAMTSVGYEIYGRTNLRTKNDMKG